MYTNEPKMLLPRRKDSFFFHASYQESAYCFRLRFHFHFVVFSGFLGEHRVNVCLGPNEDRVLMTGRHTVNDIHCCSCFQVLGWRYVSFSGPFHVSVI